MSTLDSEVPSVGSGSQFDVFALRAPLRTVRTLGELLFERRSESLLAAQTCFRAREYALFTWPRDSTRPAPPFGEEVVWAEPHWDDARGTLVRDCSVRYRFRVPDVEVASSGARGSLREASGVAVIRLIELLALCQVGIDDFLVSFRDDVDPAAHVRLIEFRENDWALIDDDGFPTIALPDSFDPYEGHDPIPDDARFAGASVSYDAAISGWHGSVVLDTIGTGGRDVHVGLPWYELAGFALGAD